MASHFCDNFKTSFTGEQSHFLKDNPAFHPIMNFGINTDPKTFFLLSNLDICDQNDASTWMWQFTYSFPTQNADEVIAMTHEQRLGMLREGSEEWIDPWKSALKWLKDGTEIPADKFNLWENVTGWDNHGAESLSLEIQLMPCHLVSINQFLNFYIQTNNISRSWTRHQQLNTGCSKLCCGHEENQGWGRCKEDCGCLRL